MIITTYPSPEVVLNELDWILPRLSRILEGSAVEALDYFTGRNETPEIGFFAHHFRYNAKRTLEGLFLADLDLVDRDVSVEELPSSGLELSLGRYKVKVLKGKEGLLPPVGRSITKRQFFDQPTLIEIGVDSDSALNLVITWDVDSNYELTELRLVCPRSPRYFPYNSSDHWSVILPPVVDIITVTEPFDDPVEDLPIERQYRLTGTSNDRNDGGKND